MLIFFTRIVVTLAEEVSRMVNNGIVKKCLMLYLIPMYESRDFFGKNYNFHLIHYLHSYISIFIHMTSINLLRHILLWNTDCGPWSVAFEWRVQDTVHISQSYAHGVQINLYIIHASLTRYYRTRDFDVWVYFRYDNNVI